MDRKRALATAAAITMSVVSGTIALGAGLTGSTVQPATVPVVATQTGVNAQTSTASRVVTILVPNKGASQPRGHESNNSSKGGQDD